MKSLFKPQYLMYYNQLNGCLMMLALYQPRKGFVNHYFIFHLLQTVVDFVKYGAIIPLDSNDISNTHKNQYVMY